MVLHVLPVLLVAGGIRLVASSRRDAERAQEAAEQARRNADKARRDAYRAEQAAKTQVADEARKTAEENLMRGIPPDIRPTREQIWEFRALHGYRDHALNIAVVGESGAGKSTLLNSIRGLWPKDPGAAPVGFNETTFRVQGYVDPNQPQFQWFDVPGANTPTISGWMYFMDQHLYIFNALVILFSDRFTQTVGTLLSKARQCGIDTFLVRTKADQLIQNYQDDHGDERLNNAQCRGRVVELSQRMVNENLNRLGLASETVYVVSARGMREWVTAQETINTIGEQWFYQNLLSRATTAPHL